MTTTEFMDEGARKWLFKYVSKNYWRVAPWIEFDDLIQEGYVQYCVVLQRYPDAVTAPHKMSLFKLCLRSYVENMVRANTKQVDEAVSDLESLREFPKMQADESFELRALLIKAPDLIKSVIELLKDSTILEELIKPLGHYDNGRRETLNDRMCKLLNKNPKKIDVVGQLRMFFSEA
jgi:hypothetical protein